MVEAVTIPCRNCEEKKDDYVPTYDWRKVKLCKYGTLKETEGIEISCPMCKRTITVIPSHQFFVD